MTEEQLSIILNKVPIIARKIHRTLRKNTSLDDLISSGYLGAIKAAKDYKPESNVPFQAYLDRRVRGEIIDDVRKSSWIPRNQLRSFKKIDKAKKILIDQLKEEPSDEQVATYLDMSISIYKRHMSKISQSKLLSLEFTISKKSEEPGKTQTAGIDPNPIAEEVLITKERNELIRKVIPQLSKNQRITIEEKFYKETPTKDIAEKLGVHTSRVGQLVYSGLHNLKLILKENGITCENYSY